MTSILIADDHAIVREGLKLLLQSEHDFEIVGEVENGRDAVHMAESVHPDIILMDIGMPELNGLEASRIILKTNPKIKIIILSMFSDSAYIKEAIHVGVSGYLVKQSAADALIEAIREVSSGGAFFSPKVSKVILDEARKTPEEKPSRPLGSLTKREREVLQLLSEGFSSPEIGTKLYISTKTVNKHRQNIMNKLKIHDVAGLTRYALENGISFKNH